ncbi:MAG: hypothetical protein ABR953_02565 [Candidatus Acidiferrales bacterium]|jgi:hypothetical protein
MKKPNLVGRIIAVLLFGLAIGFYFHHDHVTWNQLGREAFLAYQSQRFDRAMAVPDPLGLTESTFGSSIRI